MTTVKRTAHRKVQYAVRTGVLVRQPCEECGTEPFWWNGEVRVYAHHDDYDRPLDVRWLCGYCHKKFHFANGDYPYNGRKCVVKGCRKMPRPLDGTFCLDHTAVESEESA